MLKMKTTKKAILLFSIFLLGCIVSVQAQKTEQKKWRYDFEKSKKYEKSYAISPSDKIVVENKAGNIEIRIWDKNEVKVSTEIIVSAKTAEWMENVLNDIAVEDSKAGNVISFKTLTAVDLDKKEGSTKRYDRYKGHDTKQKIDVNYIIFMPNRNSLKIDNHFGDVVLPDFSGEIEISGGYGTLNAGALSNIKSISVEYTHCNIASLANTSVVFKGSDVSIRKLVGKVDLNLVYSKSSTIHFDNAAKALNIKASYSTLNLVPAANLPTSYNIVSSYGNFVNRTLVKFKSDDDGERPKFNFTYYGKQGTGTVPVNINTEYGKLILGKAAVEDMN